MSSAKYTINAYRTQNDLDSGYGPSYSTSADTLAEAKKSARYTLTEQFRESGEMSARFGYSTVCMEGDELNIVADFFSK